MPQSVQWMGLNCGRQSRQHGPRVRSDFPNAAESVQRLPSRAPVFWFPAQTNLLDAFHDSIVAGDWQGSMIQLLFFIVTKLESVPANLQEVRKPK